MNAIDLNPFAALAPNTTSELPRCDHFPQAGHLWRKEECEALTLAFAARRPLLVRGEAGSGKSQIARAAAKILYNGEPLVEVIHPRFEALDLLYRFDAVKRLADAQINKLARTNEPYVRRGRLWEAIDRIVPDKPVPVLLIDEIDKADADVPNALLDVLGNRAFSVPLLNNRIIHAPDGRLPLVIITTNEERELPAAFVRRCIVLNLNPPTDEKPDDFIDWLLERGRVHTHLNVDVAACEYAACQVQADRQTARTLGYPPVGLAEFIDLLTALHDLTQGTPAAERAEKQIDLLEKLSCYALVKNANQHQGRAALDRCADKVAKLAERRAKA